MPRRNFYNVLFRIYSPGCFVGCDNLFLLLPSLQLSQGDTMWSDRITMNFHSHRFLRPQSIQYTYRLNNQENPSQLVGIKWDNLQRRNKFSIYFRFRGKMKLLFWKKANRGQLHFDCHKIIVTSPFGFVPLCSSIFLLNLWELFVCIERW